MRKGVGYNRFVGEQASQATDLILPSTLAVPSIADCASMKLRSKQREGKNVRCVYDPAKAPRELAILLECPACPESKRPDRDGTLARTHPLGSTTRIVPQALFRCAVRSSPFVPNPPRVLLRVFAVDDCKAGLLQALGSAPDPTAMLHTLNREQERRKLALSWRRIHDENVLNDRQYFIGRLCNQGLVLSPDATYLNSI